MKISILIGFQYDNNQSLITPKITINKDTNSSLYLPGIIVDLYQAYLFSIKMNPDKIIIITDINNDQKTSVLLKAIIDEIVDCNVLNFIETIKTQHLHHLYHNTTDFLNLITTSCYGYDKAFIYYTGHAKDGSFLLPDNDNIKMTIFRNTICNSISKHGEIFFTMDCCNSIGLDLPFRLVVNDLTDSFYKLNSDFFTGQQIICISSTMKDEHSVTTRSGSIFSNSLFKWLNKKNRSIISLIKNITAECSSNFRQTATIYSSFPNIYLLWSWLFGSFNMDIILDNDTNCIIVNSTSSNGDHSSTDICFISA